jgi:hypothetical protein
MRRIRLALVACMAVYVAMSAGVGARADVGAGACVLGHGFAINVPDTANSSFVGVNVGMNSETNVFTSEVDYETQCCAETDQPPDCFDPVGAQE